MFNSNLSQAFGSRQPFANAYQDVGASTAVDGASPHKLVSLLYEALAAEITRARGAIVRGDIAVKATAIRKAVRIVDEGLRMPLNLDEGGELATNLANLYRYIVARLTLANLHNDDDALAECLALTLTMRESWDAIAGQVNLAAAA